MCGTPAREAAAAVWAAGLRRCSRGSSTPPGEGRGGTGTFRRGEPCKTDSAQGTTTLIPDKAEVTLVMPQKPNLGISIAKLGWICNILCQKQCGQRG